jgi:ribulose 1,5-bisphosphate synthetase/thiazole synthase
MSIIAVAKIQKISILNVNFPMSQNQILNHSYWELNHYFKTFDLIIVGSGIVGLSAAISYKERHKKATVLVLEKGILPDGASTKNA